MDASEFSKELDKALGLCRAAAELKLPIEAMLEHVADGIESLIDRANVRGQTALEMLASDPAGVDELNALREIVAAVGEVAAIGSNLPPASPDLTALPCPLPANLRGNT